MGEITDLKSKANGHAAVDVRSALGLTLIELLLVIAVLAVLLGLAVPNLLEFFVVNRLAAATNDLAAALGTARSEAIRRGTNVVVRSTSSIPGDWGGGWTICADANNNRTCDAGETIIRATRPVTDTIQIRSSFGLSTTIVFDSAGRLTAPGPVGGVIVVCYRNVAPMKARAVLVNLAGRIRVAVDNNGNGKPEDDSGNDITTCTPV